VKSTVNYLVECSSCVFPHHLTWAKPFDTVNHIWLFSAQLGAGVPVPVIDVVYNW